MVEQDGIIHQDGNDHSRAIPLQPGEKTFKVGRHTIHEVTGTIHYKSYVVSEGEDGWLLSLESHSPETADTGYYTAYWASSMAVDDFLTQTDLFFDRYAESDSAYGREVDIVIGGSERMQIYEAERPITRNDLIEVERNTIGDEAEKLSLLRLETNESAFTWEPQRTGFVITPKKFPDQASLRENLTEFYQSSHPAASIEVFHASLALVCNDVLGRPFQKS